MALYRPDEGRFVPEDLDPSLCTHIIYLQTLAIDFGGWRIGPLEWKDPEVDYTSESLVEESFTMDMDWAEGMYTRFHNVTKAHPGLKVSTYADTDGKITPCVKISLQMSGTDTDLHFTPLSLQRFFTTRYHSAALV